VWADFHNLILWASIALSVVAGIDVLVAAWKTIRGRNTKTKRLQINPNRSNE
jgi:hypothetical protein